MVAYPIAGSTSGSASAPWQVSHCRCYTHNFFLLSVLGWSFTYDIDVLAFSRLPLRFLPSYLLMFHLNKTKSIDNVSCSVLDASCPAQHIGYAPVLTRSNPDGLDKAILTIISARRLFIYISKQRRYSNETDSCISLY